MYPIRFLIFLIISFLLTPFLFADEAIRIGAIFSKTGQASKHSIEHLDFVRFAVEEFNEKGGIRGQKIELLEFDNGSTALGSRQAAIKAVESGVIAVLGPSWSSHALASGRVLQKAGIPMLTPLATNPKVTQIGEFIFRSCFVDSFQGKLIAKFMLEDLKAKRAVVLVNAGQIYSTGLASVFEKNFRSKGGHITASLFYSEEATNYRELLKPLKSQQFDAIFLPGYTRDSALLIRAAYDLGIKTQFIGGDGWSSQMKTYAGESINGHYYLTHWHPSVNNKKSIRFVEKYTAKNGYPVLQAGMALSFDAANLLIDAIQRANSSRPSDIKKALAETRGFQSVTGTISIDTERNPIKPAVILQFDKGYTKLVKQVSP